MPSENKYLFNGKELQDELLGSVNLDWYDYGVRFYDPDLCKKTQVLKCISACLEAKLSEMYGAVLIIRNTLTFSEKPKKRLIPFPITAHK